MNTRVNCGRMVSPQKEKVTAAVLETPRCLDTRKGKFLMQLHSTSQPYFPANLDDYAPWVAKHGLLYPYGECQCGCGKKTTIAIETRIKSGWRKNHPTRFVTSHNSNCQVRELPENTPEPGTRLIPLTRGQYAIVDEADYDWLMQWKWFASETPHTWYVQRNLPRGANPPSITMHRVILGAGPDDLVDHKDGNGLNNVRANLRLCTKEQNNRNRGVQANKSSQFKGASWDKRRGKWSARIRVNGKHKSLGYFATEVDAARAYDEAAHNAFGEFARLNFPGERNE